MQRLTLFDLSKLDDGARVVFAVPFDIFPEAVIPAGTLATVKENGLNEIWSAMLVLPDDETIREKLREWDGCIHIKGGNPGCHQDHPEFAAEWLALSPLATP